MMALHKVTTTIEPGKEIVVDDAALIDLTRDGILDADLGEVEDDTEDGSAKEESKSEVPASLNRTPSGSGASNLTPAGSGA